MSIIPEVSERRCQSKQGVGRFVSKAEADGGWAALTSFGEWSASLFEFLKDCTPQYYAHAGVLARACFYTDDSDFPE